MGYLIKRMPKKNIYEKVNLTICTNRSLLKGQLNT